MFKFYLYVFINCWPSEGQKPTHRQWLLVFNSIPNPNPDPTLRSWKYLSVELTKVSQKNLWFGFCLSFAQPLYLSNIDFVAGCPTSCSTVWRGSSSSRSSIKGSWTGDNQLSNHGKVQDICDWPINHAFIFSNLPINQLWFNFKSVITQSFNPANHLSGSTSSCCTLATPLRLPERSRSPPFARLWVNLPSNTEPSGRSWCCRGRRSWMTRRGRRPEGRWFSRFVILVVAIAIVVG